MVRKNGTKPETPTVHIGRSQEIGGKENGRIGKVYIASKNHKISYSIEQGNSRCVFKGACLVQSTFENICQIVNVPIN